MNIQIFLSFSKHCISLYYLWHGLTFGHHLISDLDSWVAQSFQHISWVQAHEVSDFISLWLKKYFWLMQKIFCLCCMLITSFSLHSCNLVVWNILLWYFSLFPWFVSSLVYNFSVLWLMFKQYWHRDPGLFLTLRVQRH